MGITGIAVSLFLLISLSIAPGASGGQPRSGSDMAMEEIKAKLASSEVTEREKYDLVIKADPNVREKLFGELISEIKENPKKELEGWEAHLLLSNGERVNIKRIAPDGHDLTLEEIVELLQGTFPAGERPNAEDVLQREGIVIKRYWAPREE